MSLKSKWWKVLGVFLVLYTVVGGILFPVPRLPIIQESIRNLYFHVPMWFGMILLFTGSLVYAIKYLRSSERTHDLYSVEFANAGVLFGILGLVTGMIWAQFTWGQWWSWDPKQNAAAISVLIYLAYGVLRGSIAEEGQRAKISAVYNVLAFSAMIPLIFILPRLQDSLHPGAGGNPGFNIYDLDGRMRAIFYPAIIGWTLLGTWLASLRIRTRRIEDQLDEQAL